MSSEFCSYPVLDCHLSPLLARYQQRIEELEAELASGSFYKESDIDALQSQLAKSVAALKRIGSGEFSGQVLTSMPPQDAATYFARTTLASLKGEK